MSKPTVHALIQRINMLVDQPDPDDECGDLAHELKEIISDKVHQLVNHLTTGLHPNIDSDIRQQLTEEFRFWR